MHTVSKRKSGQEAIVHANLTRKGLEFLVRHNPRSPAASYEAELIQGSIDEDNKPLYTNCAKHYFNPKNRLGLKTLLGQTSALEYAQQLWHQALELFAEERTRPAYHMLGRVIHLLEDMASPAHVLLVDHLLKSFKKENGRMFDENYLKQLKSMGIDLMQDSRVMVLDQGDPYEEWAARHSLENVLKFNSPYRVAIVPSFEELFVGMANETAQAQDSRLVQVLKNNYNFNPSGNGSYASGHASKNISNEDAGTLAYYLVPKLIEKVAGLIALFENPPAQARPKVDAKTEFYQIIEKMRRDFYVRGGLHTGNFREQGDNLLVRAYQLAQDLPRGQIPEILIFDKKPNLVSTSDQHHQVLLDWLNRFYQNPRRGYNFGTVADCRLALHIKRNPSSSPSNFSAPTLYEENDQLKYCWLDFRVQKYHGNWEVQVALNFPGSNTSLKLK